MQKVSLYSLVAHTQITRTTSGPRMRTVVVWPEEGKGDVMSERENLVRESPSVVMTRRMLDGLVYDIADQFQVEITGRSISQRDLAQAITHSVRAYKIHILISSRAEKREAANRLDLFKSLSRIHVVSWSNFESEDRSSINLDCAKGSLKVIVCGHDDLSEIEDLIRNTKCGGILRAATKVQHIRTFYNEWINSILD